MATGKLSLRQKMINMMYLVLLAILALNVSAEVLKAFYMMEVSLQSTGQNIDKKNEIVLNSFAKLMKTQPERTREWSEKAKKAQTITSEYVAYLQNIKKEVESRNGGRKMEDDGRESEIVNSDNTENHAHLFFNQGKANELKEKINATRDLLLALVPAEERVNIRTDMFTLDSEGKKWENATFEGVPAAAVAATLTKLQNDAKNTCADVLGILYSQTSVPDITIDSLDANIIPRKPFVMAGEKFEADIFLSAIDNKHPMEVVLNGKTYTAKDGLLKYSTIASGNGEHTVQGKIKVRERSGIKEYPFSTTYNVFSGLSTVSADNMNVMYIGLDNPITLSVPGVPTDKVKATISNGTLRKVRDNQYIARVTTTGQININVAVEGDNGTLKTYGNHIFRVKKIPGADINLGIIKPGLYSKGTLLAQRSLNAIPKFDIGFPGVNYAVTSYKCIALIRGNVQGPFAVTGAAITQQIKNVIATAKKGDVIIFMEIRGRGPLGEMDPLPTDISYTIQ